MASIRIQKRNATAAAARTRRIIGVSILRVTRPRRRARARWRTARRSTFRAERRDRFDEMQVCAWAAITGESPDTAALRGGTGRRDRCERDEPSPSRHPGSRRRCRSSGR
jgi:hypothetical protein